MTAALAMLYHDPEGKLVNQIGQVLPLLTDIFGGMAICASAIANPSALDRWREAGVLIEQDAPSDTPPYLRLGQARRRAVTLAFEHRTSHVLYVDGDRVLHWAARYPDELREMALTILDHDFTVLGRTPRAFASHPGVQRDTEGILNNVFARATGLYWDVGSGSRGLSSRAIEAINTHCPDDAISVDVTWPLCLRKLGGYTLDYVLAEGLEFETGDGYDHQSAETDDTQQWLDNLDNDPRRWAFRLKLTQLHVEKLIEYR
jgi:hypothetical protein